MEQISITDKIRIESLENWTLKQAKDIKELSERLTIVTTNAIVDDFDELKGKVDNLECNMKRHKEDAGGRDQGKVLSLSCEHCDSKFARAIDLKTHMANHDLLQKHVRILERNSI